jgi:hypothetical protein
MAALNRWDIPMPAQVRWVYLSAPGVGDGTSACVRELFTNASLGVHIGGLLVPAIAAHDTALLRVVPGALAC